MYVSTKRFSALLQPKINRHFEVGRNDIQIKCIWCLSDLCAAILIACYNNPFTRLCFGFAQSAIFIVNSFGYFCLYGQQFYSFIHSSIRLKWNEIDGETKSRIFILTSNNPNKDFDDPKLVLFQFHIEIDCGMPKRKIKLSCDFSMFLFPFHSLKSDSLEFCFGRKQFK